jgi:copper chaperone CopZ
MKTLRNVLTAFAVFLLAAGVAQAQTSKMTRDTVHVYGNCGMCEKTIEGAAYKKGEAEADWNKTTKQAVITYDASKTTLDDVLKRIADSGYDNETYRAPDKVYNKLHTCCKYERKPL